MKLFIFLSIATLSFVIINSQPVYAGYNCSDFLEGSNIDFSAGQEFIKNPPSDLYECNSDDDCSIVGDPCGWPTSVNKEFEGCYSRAAQWAGASLGCAMYQGEEKTAVCTDGTCHAK